MFQRSGDVPVGVPANMVQYAALTLMLEQLTGFPAGDYYHTISDAHIYDDQLDAVAAMVEREARRCPRSRLTDAGRRVNDIHDFRAEHFELADYDPHPEYPLDSGRPVSAVPAPAGPLLSLIVAATPDEVIGAAGDLPWHLPGDLLRFQRFTAGHTVVVGRLTHESIVRRLGRPLPGRITVVVTSAPALSWAPIRRCTRPRSRRRWTSPRATSRPGRCSSSAARRSTVRRCPASTGST